MQKESITGGGGAKLGISAHIRQTLYMGIAGGIGKVTRTTLCDPPTPATFLGENVRLVLKVKVNCYRLLPLWV